MKSLALPMLAGALLAVPPLAAQAPSTHTAPDSGRVLIDTQLGGDSTQATLVDFRRGATYLVEVRPAHAEIVLRRRVRDAQPQPLSQMPIVRREPYPSWRSFQVTAGDGGSHVVELANPTIGATALRISLLHRAPGDTAATNTRRTLVFTGDLAGAEFVTLDSGVIYRFVVHGGEINVSPRSMYKPPIRMSPNPNPRSLGDPLIPEFTGEYRIEPTGAHASLQIYQEPGDSLAYACIRNPNRPGCHGAHGGPRLGWLLAVLAIPVAIYMMQQ